MAPFSLKLSTVLTVISVALLVILSDNLFLDAWCDDVAVDAQSDVIEAGRREEGGRAKTYINFTMLLCLKVCQRESSLKPVRAGNAPRTKWPAWEVVIPLLCLVIVEMPAATTK